MKTNNVDLISSSDLRSELVLLGKRPYDWHIRQFNNDNGQKPIYPRAIIRCVQEYAKTGVKYNTIRVRKIVLVMAYFKTYAHIEDRRFEEESRWQFSKLKLKAPPKMVMYDRIPTVHDVEELLRANIADDIKLYVLFIYSTGLRRSEALSIKLDKCNIKRDSVFVDVMGKGNRNRTIYFPLWIYKKIIREFDSKVYLFQSPKFSTQSINGDTMTRKVAKVTKEVLGISFGSHMFRHAFITEMLENGSHLKAIADWVGHASTATTAGMYHHRRLKAEDFARIQPKVNFA